MKVTKQVLSFCNQPQTATLWYTSVMKVRGKSIGSQKCAHGKASGPSTRTILVAGMGTSPAVLTETVWARARRARLPCGSRGATALPETNLVAMGTSCGGMLGFAAGTAAPMRSRGSATLPKRRYKGRPVVVLPYSAL